MDHERFLILAAADVSGELTSAEVLELEAHLAECRDCRSTAAQLKQDQAWLGRALADSPVTPRVRAAVVDAARGRPQRAVWPALVAAVLLLVSIVGVALVAGSQGPSPAPGPAEPSSPVVIETPTSSSDPITSTVPTAATIAPPSSSPAVATVNGAYAYLTSSGAERRDSVTVRDTDPPTGTWSRLVPPDGASLGGPVTCLEIDGNDAWLAGPATESSDGATWKAALLFVHDSGEPDGAGDTAVAWITDPGQTLATMEGWCRDRYTPAGPFPLIDGDVVIRSVP